MTATDPDALAVQALYAALDAQRQSRGLTWPQVAREMGAVSPSTLTGMRSRRSLEGDGVLQMLRWLDLAPETFVPGGNIAPRSDTTLPRVGRSQVLRFDTKAIYTALDEQRLQRTLTWHQVANEIGGLSAVNLTRLARGGRIGFPWVVRVVSWLGRTAASFTRTSEW
jgi:hypothetical protein